MNHDGIHAGQLWHDCHPPNKGEVYLTLERYHGGNHGTFTNRWRVFHSKYGFAIFAMSVANDELIEGYE